MLDRLKSSFKRPKVRAFLRHPASLVVWFTLASVVIREQYPISHFPMYSGFEDRTWFLYFKDADGEPLQAKRAFKNTVARCKKRYGSLRDDYVEETGTPHDKLSDADHAEIGGRLIEELKRKAPEKVKKKREFDKVFNAPVTLVRVEIQYGDGEFSRVEKDIASR